MWQILWSNWSAKNFDATHSVVAIAYMMWRVYSQFVAQVASSSD